MRSFFKHTQLPIVKRINSDIRNPKTFYMQNKILITIAILFMGSMSLFAQNANAILQKAGEKVRNAKGITAHFSYSIKDKSNNTIGDGSGNMTIKGNKYYIKQGVNEIFFDGKSVWNFNGSDEVQITSALDNADAITPQKIINADFTKGYTSRVTSAAGNTYNIELVPTDKRQNFSRINLKISKSTSLINGASVQDKSGNTTIFTLSNIQTNVNVPDSRFLFDVRKYPGIEVIG